MIFFKEDLILKKAFKVHIKKGKVQTTIFRVLLFLFCQFIFIGIFSVWLVFYGPFTNIRDTFVTTIMTTMDHRYIARFFLSDKKISEIMAKNKEVIKVVAQDPTTINVNSNSDQGTTGIQIINITKSHFN